MGQTRASSGKRILDLDGTKKLKPYIYSSYDKEENLFYIPGDEHVKLLKMLGYTKIRDVEYGITGESLSENYNFCQIRSNFPLVVWELKSNS
jgi:hypothetical protein